jgi:hypothetical protein
MGFFYPRVKSPAKAREPEAAKAEGAKAEAAKAEGAERTERAKWAEWAEAAAKAERPEPCRCRERRNDHCDEGSNYTKHFLEHTYANLLQ